MHAVVTHNPVTGSALYAGAAITAVGIGALVTGGHTSIALALAAAATVGIALHLQPFTLLASFVVLASTLGGLRRLVEHLTGDVDAGLSVFVLLAVYLVTAVARAARAWDDRPLETVDRAVLALTGIVVLGALNPMSGSIAAALVGLPLAVAPLLWFWAGRSLLDPERVARLGSVIAWVTVAIAGYGLAQSYGWFTSFDAAWAARSEQTSLSIGGQVRAFGTLSSPAEYSRLLAIGFLLLLALPRSRLPGALALRGGALVVVGWALFLSGIRSAVLVTALGALLLALTRVLGPLTRVLIVGGVVLGAALVLTAPLVEVTVRDDPANSAVVATGRQLSGLREPFSDESSSATTRIDVSARAVVGAFSRPFGVGSASVTRAAARLDGTAVGGEGDIARVALAWGLPGLLAFGVVGVALVRQMVSARKSSAADVGVIAIAVAAGALLQWVNPRFYAVSPVVWLVFGAVVTASVRARDTVPAAVT